MQRKYTFLIGEIFFKHIKSSFPADRSSFFFLLLTLALQLNHEISPKFSSSPRFTVVQIKSVFVRFLLDKYQICINFLFERYYKNVFTRILMQLKIKNYNPRWIFIIN